MTNFVPSAVAFTAALIASPANGMALAIPPSALLTESIKGFNCVNPFDPSPISRVKRPIALVTSFAPSFSSDLN